ncbi:SH3 domain-containing kinase-binding protein 1 [Austrofundulus limnaeus]|uniref:Osteoclast-stimulating factor 1 n=1 Tax=Austrofundulus limnaeus TaxID=52670 RepID=A0A2I4AZ91_AUSLI|nr:PREDICTED: SH3 domain-containing kinase-binding protein 1 [Austrofundulus limnaeus]
MVEAVVEFDYEAQQEDELTLTVGDIIRNIRRDDGGWWEGELGGRRGLFPDNFVREIKKDGKRAGGQAGMVKSELSNGRASPVSDTIVRTSKKGEQIRKRRCKAAFSYVPQHEDELELKVGDVIEIITEVEEGWWEGFLNGKIGMFPSNFTKEVQTESDTPSLDTSQEELRNNRTSKDSPGSESDGADSRSETESEIQPKKVNDGKPLSVAAESMKTEPDSKAKVREQCKVLFPYEAQNEDELSLKEGDIINIITKECADAGWWMGEIGGRQGVFPDNFVKLLEVEKERPKKPPPPSTPSAKHSTEKKAEVKKVPPERPEHLPHRDQDRGEEMKVGEIPKPSLPSHIPKKPLLPKSSSSSSSHPPRRPERPPTLASESPKSEGGASTPDSAPDRSNVSDIDLDAVVTSTEKLSHPTASRPRVTDRRPRSQILSASFQSSTEVDSPTVEDRKEKGKEEHESVSVRHADAPLKKRVPAIPVQESKAPQSKPSVLSPPNSGQRSISPSSSSGLTPSPELRHSPLTPPSLEELKSQLRDLRSAIDLLKTQHKQEMKQLANALDEEKKMRLSLQVEVEHIKKNLSK